MPPSDIERYAASYAHCVTKAEATHIAEIAAFWSTIAGSYKFLLEREQRLFDNDKKS